MTKRRARSREVFRTRESEKPEGHDRVPRAIGAARHFRSRARHIALWHADLRQDVDRPVTPSTTRRQRSKTRKAFIPTSND